MRPILYTYRRCPYAMRARLALAYAGIRVDMREISLRNKPIQLLKISPKGTVPVLMLPNGKIIDQSLDIMLWALEQSDSHYWLGEHTSQLEQQLDWIDKNDNLFKPLLDRYKYPERNIHHYKGASASPSNIQLSVYFREQAKQQWLDKIETQLKNNPYLIAPTPKLIDYALMPFLRQFARVDSTWFETSGYSNISQWLNALEASELFTYIMFKLPTWHENHAEIIR